MDKKQISMDDSRNIIWLASYPKSGNTWFRIFLTNILKNQNEPANINELETSPIASNRALFDEATGLSSSDLTPGEIEELRPGVYLHLAKTATGIVYQKIHDAFVLTQQGKPIIPEDATKGVIYFIRNPLDIVISFAHHSSLPVDRMIDLMSDDNYSLSSKTDRLHIQLRQRLLSWSDHVKSWVDYSDLPLCLIKYEDMHANPFGAFKKAIKFIGLEASDEQIKKAIKFCDIKELQRQEKEKGFDEKPPNAKSFFRKGIAGDWKSTLTKEQIERIINNHGEVMKRFGYL